MDGYDYNQVYGDYHVMMCIGNKVNAIFILRHFDIIL